MTFLDLCKYFYLASKLKTVRLADYTNLFLSDENRTELFQQMNTELERISTWFKANKLCINIDKTK